LQGKTKKKEVRLAGDRKEKTCQKGMGRDKGKKKKKKKSPFSNRRKSWTCTNQGKQKTTYDIKRERWLQVLKGCKKGKFAWGGKGEILAAIKSQSSLSKRTCSNETYGEGQIAGQGEKRKVWGPRQPEEEKKGHCRVSGKKRCVQSECGEKREKKKKKKKKPTNPKGPRKVSNGRGGKGEQLGSHHPRESQTLNANTLKKGERGRGTRSRTGVPGKKERKKKKARTGRGGGKPRPGKMKKKKEWSLCRGEKGKGRPDV